ncbi:unnamed protein product, partial [Phaeothamnion confervicola]
DDAPFEYHEVNVDDLIEEDDGDVEDLSAALASLRLRQAEREGGPRSEARAGEPPAQVVGRVVTQVRPAVVEDFVRNFLLKAGLTRTLDCFNAEWYELQAKGRLPETHTTKVPDIYLRNEELDEQVGALRAQLLRVQEIAERAQATWDKFRRERDFHRLHHKRVAQEKARLVVDMKRLQKHYKAYEPTLQELQRRYQVAMKEKMLTKLERDRLRARLTMMEAQAKAAPGGGGGGGLGGGGGGSGIGSGSGTAGGSSRAGAAGPGRPTALPSVAAMAAAPVRRKNDLRLPHEDTLFNPHAETRFPVAPADSFTLKKSFKGHLNSVAAVAFHPRKPVIATVSDDETWKIWSVPKCELIMSGEGHSGWISGVHFHPQGSMLATASGDNTVKLWDFARAACSATLSDHTQAVWDVAWHHGGDFLASASMDHTARLWDAQSLRCRQTFRGHVDSVNAICWQPYTNNVITASGDKTVSLWDARSGLCVQTFYGHMNAVNHVCAALAGAVVASCDADGSVKLWDVRMVAEVATMAGGQHPLNRLCFDRSGARLAVASDDASIKVFDVEAQAVVAELRGHDEAVQCVAFSPADEFLVSASSDCTFRLWS